MSVSLEVEPEQKEQPQVPKSYVTVARGEVRGPEFRAEGPEFPEEPQNFWLTPTCTPKNTRKKKCPFELSSKGFGHYLTHFWGPGGEEPMLSLRILETRPLKGGACVLNAAIFFTSAGQGNRSWKNHESIEGP